MKEIGVGIIGCGGISLQNHLPGLALCEGVRVTALCDASAEVLGRAQQKVPAAAATAQYEELVQRADVQAVIVATPNILHAPIVLAAIQNGKHVFCEKPLAMNFAEATGMFRAAERAGVRHMTAFTYRFVPAMRYLHHLVKSGAIGQPYHFRNCRLQDWGQRNLGWRQVAKLAGSGEMGDMLSHRLDFAHLLLGPMTGLVARTRLFHPTRGGAVSDLEDWVGVLADFEVGATGMLESSKVATGHGESAHSQDYVELNGSEGSIRYDTENPFELWIGKRGEVKLSRVELPREFRVWPGSKRNPDEGDPRFVWRYDQNYEFIAAIREGRACVPSFRDGALVQGVIDAALESERDRRWIDLRPLTQALN